MIRDEAYLRHILDAIEVVGDYAATGEDDFMRDGMRQDAIVRQLAVIGEAVKLLSAEAGKPSRRFHGATLPECATASFTVTRAWT